MTSLTAFLSRQAVEIDVGTGFGPTDGSQSNAWNAMIDGGEGEGEE